MRKKIHQEEEHENHERWMVSYADFVTLLFCFFTAMYAISNVDTNKLGKFVDSMRSAFNVENGRGNAVSVIDGIQIFVPADIEVESNVKDILGTIVTESRGTIGVKRDSRGVVISVADRHFFAVGSAHVKDEAIALLDKIAEALLKYNNMIHIEGHTDNVPISTSQYPSNWELSAARSINVAKYLIQEHAVPPGRISTLGYAEFRPLASNDTPAGRAQNRRVEIILVSEQKGARF
jgi:chemotaxis protein MotB